MRRACSRTMHHLAEREGDRTMRTFRGSALAVGLVALLVSACIGGGGSPGVPQDAGNLSGLEVIDGTQAVAISPAFDPAVTNYSVSVGGSTAALAIKATSTDSRATIRINNSAAVSGQAYGPLALAPGSNTLNIVVDVPGGVKAYIVTVLRGANANLAALAVAPGSLAEYFDPNVVNYSAIVGNGTGQVRVTATLADPASTLKIKGQAVNSGQPSALIAVAVGSNPIDVVVTALDGATKTYVLTVTRSASPLADLASIALANAVTSQSISYTPGFTANTLNYTTQTVAFGVSSVNVTVTVADPTSSLAIQSPGQAFQPATAGVAFGPIALPNALPTANTILIRVTAQNGTVKTYTVAVPRSSASSNANLQALTVSSSALTPAFTPAVLNYHVSIPAFGATVTIAGTAQDPTAKVQINNQPPILGVAAVPVSIVGGTPITISVIAEDGTPKTYTIVFNTDANLSSLSLSAGAIQPVFNPAIRSYSLLIPTTTSTTTVTANAAGPVLSYSTDNVSFVPLGINVPSAALSLNPGANTITVRATAPVGSYQDYVVTVTRPAPGNVDLTSLTVSSGTLTPAFNPAVLNYTVNVANAVTSLTVGATAQAPAVVTLAATPPGGAGQSSPLQLNSLGVITTTVSIVVNHTAGNSQTYTLTITRNSADLSNLIVAAGSVELVLNPLFNAATLSYLASAPPLTSQVTVTPTSGGTVTVNGNLPTAPVTLTGPSTPISIVVTPAGVGLPTTTYTVTVTK